jgi:acetyltransferase-like isoleucine patch superfamily enzyme
VKAVHGLRTISADPSFELGLAEYLRQQNDPRALVALYDRFASGESDLDARMRRALWRALSRQFGDGVQIGPGARFLHPETFRIGRGVFVGAQTYIQGRLDGTCTIGDQVWIGPGTYLDARDLVIGERVGLGPGVRVLGSTHTGVPHNVPIIQTDLEIGPVRIEAWADVGVNAVLLPGLTVGRGSIVGAGAVVTRDVPAFAVVAGVPARLLRWRNERELPGAP